MVRRHYDSFFEAGNFWIDFKKASSEVWQRSRTIVNAADRDRYLLTQSIAASNFIKSDDDITQIDNDCADLYHKILYDRALHDWQMDRSDVDFLKMAITDRDKGFSGAAYSVDQQRMFAYFQQFIDRFFALQGDKGILRVNYTDTIGMSEHEYIIYLLVQAFTIKKHNELVKKNSRR